jgi:hypothetical protein
LKKRRRVEVHIEHRETTVFVGPGTFAGQQKQSVELCPLDPLRSRLCPVCGSSQLLPLIETVASPGIDLRLLQQGMENGSVHLHQSSNGSWWLCTESLQQS